MKMNFVIGTWCNAESYHLVCQQQDSLEAELSGAKVEEVLQTWTEQLHNHHIVVSFSATPLYGWNAH